MDIFLVAPHFEYPPIKTEDRYIFTRYTRLKNLGQITIIGNKKVFFFKEGELVSSYTYTRRGKISDKLLPVLRSLLLRKNYLYEKQNFSKDFLNEYKSLLNKYKPNVIVLSYIYLYIFLTKNNLIKDNYNYLCETHNDDRNWFLSLKYKVKFKYKFIFSPKNLFRFLYEKAFNIICDNSIEWLIHNTKKIDKNVKFVYLTKIDKENASVYMNNSNSRVITQSSSLTYNNFQINEPFSKNKKISSINLLFVGTLDLKMNYDSLCYFEMNFLKTIIELIKGPFNVNIVGFNPTRKIYKLCKNNNWKLVANAKQSELIYYYKISHLSILPFSYTNGFKGKYVESIAAGLPILGTENVRYINDVEIPLSLFSNSPEEWVRHLNSLYKISEFEYYKKRLELKKYLSYFQEEEISKQLYEYINI